MMKSYELIIVGGGLVGAGLACALRHLDMKVALIDARLPSANDPRLFALNHSSCQFLENIGIWPELAAKGSPIHQVHVSHQGHFGSVRLRREEVGASSLGHVIPAYFIEHALNHALSTSNNVTLYRPATLKTLTQTDELATLIIEQDGENIALQAKSVIGADGAESLVRNQANIQADIVDYQQCAIVTRTILQRSHQQIAYERFLSTGAIAMLPLSGEEKHECATIWTADQPFASELMAMSDSDFLQALQNNFGYRLGRLQRIATRHVFPLRMLQAEKAAEKCVILLGNALHTLHPIAAQGFNLALYEVAALVEGIQTGNNLHDIMAHTREQQKRSMRVSDGLPHYFSKQSLLWSIATQLGMVGFDVAAPLKRKFINGMMGRLGRIPHLLTGAPDDKTLSSRHRERINSDYTTIID